MRKYPKRCRRTELDSVPVLIRFIGIVWYLKMCSGFNTPLMDPASSQSILDKLSEEERELFGVSSEGTFRYMFEEGDCCFPISSQQFPNVKFIFHAQVPHVSVARVSRSIRRGVFFSGNSRFFFVPEVYVVIVSSSRPGCVETLDGTKVVCLLSFSCFHFVHHADLFVDFFFCSDCDYSTGCLRVWQTIFQGPEYERFW